tara:strand:+ start:174 stop:551 length:378 start_codon:yes stop_codon:yes gene_type:complete
MIQRLQTLYLFFVFLFSCGLFYSSTMENTTTIYSSYYGFILSPIISIITILLFKKRPLQIFLCFLLLLLQAIQIGFYVRAFQPPDGFGWTEYVVVFSLINFFLITLARRGIRKDQNLVRSIDRIR